MFVSAVLSLSSGSVAKAHSMTMTQILVSFGDTGKVDVKIDIDLTLLLGSPERYYEIASEQAEKQLEDIRDVTPRVVEALPLFIGQQRLPLAFRAFSTVKAQKSDYLDGSTSNLATFTFVATLPTDRGPLKLEIPIGAEIDYPVAYTIQIPSAHLSITRWLEVGIHDSEPFAWADKVPAARGAANTTASAASNAAASPPAAGPARVPPPSRLSPANHSIRTLFLGRAKRWCTCVSAFTTSYRRAPITFSSCWACSFSASLGASSCPRPRYSPSPTRRRCSSPLTAFFACRVASWNPRSRCRSPGSPSKISSSPNLGPARLAIVFCFGLVHGLGFASSLSSVPFPKHDFVIALLGFNFGVDFGQLFVIALAFLAVGWFRKKPWFRPRIAIPCSVAIAVVGLVWAVQRIYFYSMNPS